MATRRHVGSHPAMARTHKTVGTKHETQLEILKCWRRWRQRQRRLCHASFASCCLLDAAVVIPRSSASADRHSSSGRRRRRRNITSFVHFWPLSPPLQLLQLPHPEHIISPRNLFDTATSQVMNGSCRSRHFPSGCPGLIKESAHVSIGHTFRIATLLAELQNHTVLILRQRAVRVICNPERNSSGSVK